MAENIGNTHYSVIKNNPDGVAYLKINNSQFQKLKNSEIGFSAFHKEDGSINLAFSKKDAEKLYKELGLKRQVEIGNIEHTKFKKSVDSLEFMAGLTEGELQKLKTIDIKFSGFPANNKGTFNVYVEPKDKIKAFEGMGRLINLGNTPLSKIHELTKGLPRNGGSRMDFEHITAADIEKLKKLSVPHSIVPFNQLMKNPKPENKDRYVLSFDQKYQDKVRNLLYSKTRSIPMPM